MEGIFHFRLLGPVQVERNGEPVPDLLKSRKALALLGYLAGQGQPIPREQLVDLFWGAKTEARGRANLSAQRSIKVISSSSSCRAAESPQRACLIQPFHSDWPGPCQMRTKKKALAVLALWSWSIEGGIPSGDALCCNRLFSELAVFEDKGQINFGNATNEVAAAVIQG